MELRRVPILILTIVLSATAFGFIERWYTIQEVIDASTNILFGRVSLVDKVKQRVIIDVQRNVKGKSHFRQIKVNVAVGDIRPGKSTPQMLLEKVKPNLPAVVFYQDSGEGLAGLVYTNGIWFQIFGNKSREWWNFSHIEIYMGRTYQGDTERFQRIIEAMVSGKGWPELEDTVRVLVLTGHGSQLIVGQANPNDPSLITTYELAALMRVRKVGRWNLFYKATKDPKLPDLEGADILWIGFREMYRNGYHLEKETEARIRRFVKEGGVVIVSGQDYDEGVNLGTGWIPEPIKGVELNAMPVRSTGKLEKLLRHPRKVDVNRIVIDDAWRDLSGRYTIGLVTVNGGHAVLAQLKYGDGLYLITALANSDMASVSANEPLIENLIHYAVEWVRR